MLAGPFHYNHNGMGIRESSYGYWSSNRGFLWVAGGTAMGIGNIVRLPYMAGEYGGSVFLAAYVLALVVLSWPLLLSEWLIGRWTREDLVSGLVRLSGAAGPKRAWVLIGALALLAAVIILSYYSVIAGWSLAYTFRAAGGLLENQDSASMREVFFTLAQDPERSLAWHTIFMVMVCVIVAHGVRDGIERAAGYLVPTACVLMLSLFLYAYTAGQGQTAILHVLQPDWSRFGWRGALEAFHQAFYTMALAMGAMYAYGSYLPASAPLGRLAAGVIVLDTVFSLLAGCALYALVFAAGLNPAPGITLLFQVFPQALPAGLEGVGIATVIYVVLFITALIAAVALLEPTTRFLMERYRLTRVFAATSAALLIWFLGLGTLLSFNVWREFHLLGLNFFEWMQMLTGRALLPLTALLLCVFIARFMPADLIDDLWGDRAPWLKQVWLWMLRYPARLLLIVLLPYELGIVDALITLFR
jgi:neurotransmitter:Na+ symporter, NSS family